MIARDRVQEAVDELYGGDPADFLPHRKELAAQARAAKDRDAAKAIAALRKPTRSAHLLNQLSRREPERVDALLRLTDSPDTGGGRSRRDALTAMRELTTRRRRLVDDLTDRAFAGAGEDSPTTALRDEVVATLNAALGDPDVGTELAEGRLVRSHEWAGFGFSAADLALVPDDDPADTDDSADDDAVDDTEGDEPVEPEDEDEDTDEDDELEDEEPADDPADDDEAERAEENRSDVDEDVVNDAIAEAQAALSDADRDLEAQRDAEQEQQDRVAALEDELTEAQIRLDEIRVAIRRAEMVQRRARSAMERHRDGR